MTNKVIFCRRKTFLLPLVNASPKLAMEEFEDFEYWK